MNPFRTFARFALIAVFACFSACAEDESPIDDLESQEVTACRGPFNCHLPNPGNSHRYRNPATDDGRWPLRARTHLRDGVGSDRGVIVDASAFVNYGQRKMLLDEVHVYVWNVVLAGGMRASGWVRESAFVDSLRGMPTVHARNPGRGDAREYVVRGGDPAAHPLRHLKFDRGYTGPNREPGDYLTRPGGVVNLLYNLPFPGIGGITTDTLPVGVRFVRAAGVDAIDVPLYEPGGDRAVASMRFYYGRVGVRFGWIAADALDAVTPSSPAPPSPPPGSVPTPPAERRCCALCRFRAAYHAVDVSSDCAAHARTFCSASSRGGLIDAMWGACN